MAASGAVYAACAGRERLHGQHTALGAVLGSPALSAAERRLMLDTKARLHAALARLDRQPSVYSMIHADMHPGNVLVDGDRLTVIDFDDAAWGWHAYDIAVALVHQQERRNSAALERAYVAGYRSVRRISDKVADAGADVPAGARAGPRSAGITSAPNSSGRHDLTK